MPCCDHCQGAGEFFDIRNAKKELKDYHQHGASKTSQILIDALKTHTIAGTSLLDIGGGVGAIQHELVSAGVNTTTHVDASQAYLMVAQGEAEKRGYAERASYLYGDFVDLAADIDAADIVTLDRVICCYPNVTALVANSVQHAQQLYGVVYPRDNWLMRLFMPILNLFLFRLRGNPFRVFVHSSAEIDNLIRGHGFEQTFHKKTPLWQIAVYQKD